ncbi:hypothetical protein RhiirC2_868247 [Rhizophagus irregularis]|uniref:Uncharacterized protein n=1 Tax=Rhizophagus irregularis TaxID=588596 RepID=A0A2N1MY96_9GLOM|nr:hypothetical protein RhiirC2_868247 [Rhizophagus irregularis]
MEERVRDEKHYLMFIVYIGNFIQALLLYFDMVSLCERKNKLIQCFQYSIMLTCTFFIIRMFMLDRFGIINMEHY